MPSMMYKWLVSPPAHRGPRMVARPPTERLTPWLKPVGGSIKAENQRLSSGDQSSVSRALRHLESFPT